MTLSLDDFFKGLCDDVHINIGSARTLNLELGRNYGPDNQTHKFELIYQDVLNQQCRGLYASLIILAA